MSLLTKSLGKTTFVFDSVMGFMWKLIQFEPNFFFGGGGAHTQKLFLQGIVYSIAIINQLLLNTPIFFIKITETFLYLYLFVLWSDLESSRMCRNKILIPPFGACSSLPPVRLPMSHQREARLIWV